VVLVELPGDVSAFLVGSTTPTSCRRWPCSATCATGRSGPCSCRSPSSAPSGRRCAGPTPARGPRSGHRRTPGPVDGAPADGPGRSRSTTALFDDAAAPPIRWPSWPRRPASRRRALVGRRRRAPRRRSCHVHAVAEAMAGRCARAGNPTPARPAARPAMRQGRRKALADGPSGWRSCAGPGTCLRSDHPTGVPPASADAARCAGNRR
jgi:hypothetical protein